MPDNEVENKDKLSYELLKKENEELKKQLNDFKTEVSKQLEDIKEVVRVSTTTQTQTENNEDDDAVKRRQLLLKKLQGTFNK